MARQNATVPEGFKASSQLQSGSSHVYCPGDGNLYTIDVLTIPQSVQDAMAGVEGYGKITAFKVAVNGGLTYRSGAIAFLPPGRVTADWVSDTFGCGIEESRVIGEAIAHIVKRAGPNGILEGHDPSKSDAEEEDILSQLDEA